MNNMIDINKEAEEYAELNQYDLSEHDEGGYLGIDEKTFAKHLIEFATNSKATQAKVIQGQIDVLKEVDFNMCNLLRQEANNFGMSQEEATHKWERTKWHLEIESKINELQQQLKQLENEIS
jgi:hypothetical protein